MFKRILTILMVILMYVSVISANSVSAEDIEEGETVVETVNSDDVPTENGSDETAIADASAQNDDQPLDSFEEETADIVTVVPDSAETTDETTEETEESFEALSLETSLYSGKNAIDFTIDCNEEAKIPQDSNLEVTEIAAGTVEYSYYLTMASQKLGVDKENVKQARFFNIEIKKDGEKIEPSDTVQVKIRYAKAFDPANSQVLSIVHFDEESIEIIPDVTIDERDIVFETESFSVYAVLTEELPQSADDLDGWSATFDRNGRYVTSFVNYNSGDPFRLGKSSNPSDAAVWTFERSGEGYGYTFYHISTVVNGQKRYLYINPLWYNYNAAHTTLEMDNDTTPAQDFAVIINGDGTYTIFIVFPNYNWTESYLNEWEGQWGNGFAGYGYRTDDDHLHFNFQPVQPVTQNGGDYVVVIENEETGKYYAVQAEGDLVEVEYDESTGVARVKLEKPIVWALTSAHDGLSDDTLSYNAGDDHPDWEPYNLRIHYDARLLNQGTQLSEGDYFRYISPAETTGIYEESETNSSHDWAKWANAIRYEDHTVHGIVWNGYGFDNTNQYVGADFENMHVTGNVDRTNAAKIHLAIVENVPDVSSDNETVSHIDIGIKAKGYLKAPLAYGKYYDEEGNLLLEVSPENDVTLELEKELDITKEDIMEADLAAYDEDGNEVDDAFYIDGYTANEHTGHSAVQVRMEGSFKVTTLDPYNGWYNRSNDDMDRRAERLQNKIYYEISFEDEVNFPLTYKGKQLYGMNGKPLSVTAPMKISARFNYWSGTSGEGIVESENECPPLQEDFEETYPFLIPDGPGHEGRNNENWQSGAIIDNNFDTSYLPYGMPPYPGDSGMDFILEANVELKDRILAIEIAKYLVDAEGNTIIPSEDVSNTFKLYCKENADQDDVASVAEYAVDGEVLSDLESKQVGYAQRGDDITFVVPGGEDGEGVGVYYDYDVVNGMYYVEEMQPEAATIIDADGRTWIYKETRVETEYVWRNDNYSSDPGRHIAPESLSGVPEILGPYEFEGWEDVVDEDDEGNPIQPRNGFLEFHIYNVYEDETEVIEPHKKEVVPFEGTGECGEVNVGDTVTYEISYTNYLATAVNVVVNDKLDPNVEFVSASNGGELKDGVVIWTLEDVDPNEEGTVTVTVKVLESALKSKGGPGLIVNGGETATVQIGNDPVFTLEEVTNPVKEPEPDNPPKDKDIPFVFPNTGVDPSWIW